MENMNLRNLPDNIRDLLQKYISGVIDAYDIHVRKIILFGSYARGDFDSDSDIDIMVLVDYPREDIGKIRSKMSDISFELSYDNNIEINPLIQNEDFFTKWIRSYPFYNNVANEGVELYAA